VNQLLSDLRYGTRMLRKTPVSTAIAVVSLGFAISTNTTAFSVASAFLFNTFRWRAPQEMVLLYETSRTDDDDHGVAPGNYLDWKESSARLAGLEAYHVHPANLTGGDEPERIDVVDATAGIFELLGTPMLYGRGFRAEDAAAADQAARAAVVTQSFFEHRLGGDPRALGAPLSVDGAPHTVVGVLRPDFDFLPADVELFRPVDLAARRHDRVSHDYYLLGRLAPGSSKDDLVAELTGVTERLALEHPDTNRGNRVHVETLREVFPGKTDTLLQYILLTVSALVLLIASANLVSLFLARGDTRRSELALRFALGAGRARLGRQLLVESLLVAGLGGVLGVVGSIAWIRSMHDIMPAMLPEVFHPKLDARVLLYGVLVSLVAGALLGSAPALQASRVDPAVALGETSRGGTGSRRRRRLRAAFIVAETGGALALLTAATTLTDTFNAILRENGSITVDGVLTLELTADEHRFPTDAEVIGFHREVVRRLGELPGVESAAGLTTLPRSRDQLRAQLTIDGRPAPSPTEAPWTGWQSVTPAFFSTLRVPIVAGRSLLESDRADAAPVVVVNQRFAHQHFPGEEALGRRITMFGASREIVGICGDFVQSRIAEADRPEIAVFLPFEQHPVRTSSLAARVDGDPMALADAARQAVWRVDPDQPVVGVQTLRASIDTSLAGPRVLAVALTLLGTVALVLSAIGMYGLIAHDVGQRRRELGIRMALGAAPGRVVAAVTLRGLAIAGVGVVIGLPAAWAMSRIIGAALPGLAAVRLGSLAILIAVLAAVALIASTVPALSAARIRPARVLQIE
jgi:putative ABC transport system permease protein